jgi:hypothetical protein
MDEKDLEEVATIEGWMEAEILKRRLESFEIPVLLQYETAGRIFGITMNGLGKVRVLVPGDRLGEARQLLERDSDVEEPGSAPD